MPTSNSRAIAGYRAQINAQLNLSNSRNQTTRFKDQSRKLRETLQTNEDSFESCLRRAMSERH